MIWWTSYVLNSNSSLEFNSIQNQDEWAVETTNKNIKKILQKMAEAYWDWHEKLLFALLAYQTSIRSSTGARPFSLVYEVEAVLPIGVEIL